MKRHFSRACATLIATALIAVPAFAPTADAATSASDAAPATAADLSAKEARELALDAYLYAYPMVLSELTRRVMTNTEAPADVGLGRAPMNQLGHRRSFPSDTDTDATRPNADALYSVLWYDVSREPMTLTVPDSQGRFYLLQMSDLWSETFAVPGKRTTGTGPQQFVIASLDWKGVVPQGATLIRSPTPVGWVLGRTQANGSEDFPAVRTFQDGWQAAPLSRFGKTYTPKRGSVDPHMDMRAPFLQVRDMQAATFFPLFAELMRRNPPHLHDFSVLQRIRRLGLEPGKEFSFDQAPQAVQQAMVQAMGEGEQMIQRALLQMGTSSNGWRKNNFGFGSYGNDYLRRALLAYAGTVANPVDDAMYPIAITDTDGKPLDAKQRYTMHFDKSQLPPARAFWSLSMYDQRQFFTQNPIQRFAIGDRDKLRFNADGSLDLYIQRESPGADKETNWLPTPADGRFTMILRLYWPEWTAIDGSWLPPGVKRMP